MAVYTVTIPVTMESFGTDSCIVPVKIDIEAYSNEEAADLLGTALGRLVQRLRHQNWLDRNGG